MSAFHGRPVVSGVFDDPNLVSCAGLVPVLGLGRRCGMEPLLRARLTVSGPGAADPAGKTVAVLAGMLAGADSIDDLGLLRHGGLPRLLGRVWAPSTLGSFLRSFRFGHVRQLDAVAARLLPRLAGAVPLLPGADQVAFVDVDDTIREVHGYQKQGAGFGYSGVRGLNAVLATVSTPLAAPVIAGTRLRRGSVNSARGARRLLTDALVVARRSGATGLVIVRADSAYYARDVIAAATRAGARFSVTARLSPAVHTAIAGIPDTGWTAIRYPKAVFDPEEQRWISDAEVAETEFTAFTSRPRADRVTARLIIRRVRRLGGAPGQGELLPGYRYHAVFTDTPATNPGRGELPPPPRDHRTGHRRPQSRTAHASALGEVHRERRLARPRRDQLQPHPRRRLRRWTRSRPSHDPDPAPPTGHRARPDRLLRPPARPAPAPTLALATRLGDPLRQRLRTTRTRLTRPPTPPGLPETISGEAGQTGRARTR